MNDRIQEINLEIKTLLKTDPTSKKLESLQRELKELLIKERVSPTNFRVTEKERKPRKQRQKTERKKISSLIKESNLIDFQNARASKVAEEFSNEIKTGKLYNELRPKKEKKN